MDPKSAVPVINEMTKDFNRKVQQLINEGKGIDEIITALQWDKSPFSLVRNNKRNIPAHKYDLFNNVFKFENVGTDNQHQEKENVFTEDYKDKYIKLLEEHNKELSEKLQINLQTVLGNQLATASLLESVLDAVSLLIVPGDEKGRADLKIGFHKEAIQRLMDLKRKGTKLEIDSEDIVSSGGS